MVVPEVPSPEDIYIPSDDLEYITWLIKKQHLCSISELTHRDYISSLEVCVDSFEDIYYHIDMALLYIDPKRDVGEVVYPTNPVPISLIEFRYNCSREYKSMDDLMDILAIKYINFFDKVNSLDEADRHYIIRRWSRLLCDIINVFETVLSRASKEDE